MTARIKKKAYSKAYVQTTNLYSPQNVKFLGILIIISLYTYDLLKIDRLGSS